ncbi:PREDICTED: zinc finger protein 883-like [Nanorana parkeri]|uniref:zinc finger protein 883-like n=1 Tax=Nanorana parkeri TaxID=125878 RepID=UPI0008548EEE|nr:PREDICTED: zinc finger protein 883-like [Nanorana parkeri]
MVDDEETYKAMGSEKADGFHKDPMLSQNGGLNKGSSKTFLAENVQPVGTNLTPIMRCLERVHRPKRNASQDQNLPHVMKGSSSPAKERRDSCVMECARFQAGEEPPLTFKAKERIDLNHMKERLADFNVYPKAEAANRNRNKLESKSGEGQRYVETDMCPTGNDPTFPINNDPYIQMSLLENNIVASPDRAGMEYEEVEAETDEGARGLADPYGDPRFVPSLNEEIVFNFHEASHTGQKLFVCSECGECFPKNSQLVEHHRLHSAEKPFACPECGKQFADRANVIAHQLVHAKLCAPVRERSSGEGRVVCSECGMTLADGSAFEEHLKVHSQEKAFVCPVCGKSFSRRGHLSNHKKIHNGGKPISYSEGGNKRFPHSSYTRKRSFQCPECGKCFPSRCHLDRHQRVHTGEKPFSCAECDKRFTDRSGLVIHQRIHTGEKPYACYECGKRFRDRSGLVVHQRTHTGEQPYKCLQCGKCFHNRTRLDHHKSVHAEEKAFTCSQCDQVFLDVTAFALHQRAHFAQVGTESYPPQLLSKQSQEAPQLFLCPECGKSFDDPSVLSLHISTHRINPTKSFSEPTHFEPQHKIAAAKLYPRSEGEQSSQFASQGTHGLHACSQCNQRFSDLASLTAHEQQHSEEKPYKCAKCGECFVLKGYLMKHLETHV